MDRRRKIRFSHTPNSFARSCERLGLFQTRMPRFKQLFFHEFHEHEVVLQIGQSLTSLCSRRAAQDYLASGARLESKCGLSDVWYHYVESHRHLFEDPGTLQSLSADHCDHPHPRLDERHAPAIYSVLDWYKRHTRPRPRKVKAVALSISPSSTLKSPCRDISDVDVINEGTESIESWSSSTNLSYADDISEFSDDAQKEDYLGFSRGAPEDFEEGVVQEEAGEQDLTDASQGSLDGGKEGGIKGEFSDIELDDWSASFEKAVVESMDVMESRE